MAKVVRIICDDCGADDTLRRVSTYRLEIFRSGKAFGRTTTVDLCNLCRKKAEEKLFQSFKVKLDTRWSGKKRAKVEEEENE